MIEAKIRTVLLFKNFFTDFYEKQKVKDKIIWILKLIETIQQVPEEFLKHLEGTDGLYEIRIKHGSDIFRIFCFFDEEKNYCFSKRLPEKRPKIHQ